MQVVGQLFEISGIGRDRLQLRWVSSAEGQLFAEYVTELTEVIRGLGALDGEQLKLPLAAVTRALQAPPLRWLMGMERQLTEQENVFHERLDGQHYRLLLMQRAEEEYQKALLLEVLREGPKTVPEMAEETGLAPYTVSRMLNHLENTGLADVSGHEGTSFKFKLLEA
jgi:hypothetical protein